jgi:hypothetical protein
MQCKRCSNEALENRTLCQKCNELKLINARNRYSTAKANGKCTKFCGNDAIEGQVLCTACHVKVAQRQKIYYTNHVVEHAVRSKKFSDNNKKNLKCMRCNNPAIEGQVLCEYHRVKNLENMKTYGETSNGKLRNSNYRNDNAQQIKIIKKAYCANNPHKPREWNHKRRALRHNAFVATVNSTSIFERDNWVCQLCHKKVDKNVHRNHWDYPTIDHIIPLVKGGTHEPSNVQCAHMGCNNQKGAKYPISDPATIKLMIEFNRVFIGGDH